MLLIDKEPGDSDYFAMTAIWAKVSCEWNDFEHMLLLGAEMSAPIKLLAATGQSTPFDEGLLAARVTLYMSNSQRT